MQGAPYKGIKDVIDATGKVIGREIVKPSFLHRGRGVIQTRRGPSVKETHRETGIGLPGQTEVDVPPEVAVGRKRYAYRGILHHVSTILGDSVKEIRVTPGLRDAPLASDSVMDVCVTPCYNVSVTRQDDQLVHKVRFRIIF